MKFIKQNLTKMAVNLAAISPKSHVYISSTWVLNPLRTRAKKTRIRWIAKAAMASPGGAASMLSQ
jgi:hypothetical protein